MATKNAINSNIPIEVSMGGTGASSLTDHGLVIANAGNAFTATAEGGTGTILIGTTGAVASWLAAGSAGEVLTANTGAAPSWEPPSAGGLTWSEEAGTTHDLAVDTGTICNNAAQVVCTLPASIAVGKTIRVCGKGSGKWKIAQRANQYIKFGTQTTATGTGGYISATEVYDAVELLCITADVGLIVIGAVGNLTVA